MNWKGKLRLAWQLLRGDGWYWGFQRMMQKGNRMTISDTIGELQEQLSGLKDQLEDFQARIAKEGSIHHQEFVQNQILNKNKELKMLNNSQKIFLEASWRERDELKTELRQIRSELRVHLCKAIDVLQRAPQGENQYGESNVAEPAQVLPMQESPGPHQDGKGSRGARD